MPWTTKLNPTLLFQIKLAIVHTLIIILIIKNGVIRDKEKLRWKKGRKEDKETNDRAVK